MSIVLARIDNRLIHGQILEAWVPVVHANLIVVANDQIAGLTLQKILMEAAVPRGIRVFIGTLNEVVQLFQSHEVDSRRVLLLFANVEDALEGHRMGMPFSEINLGNMHGGQGKMRVTCTLALDEDDIGKLEALEEQGVNIVSQCIPTDRQENWRKIVPREKNSRCP